MAQAIARIVNLLILTEISCRHSTVGTPSFLSANMSFGKMVCAQQDLLCTLLLVWLDRSSPDITLKYAKSPLRQKSSIWGTSEVWSSLHNGDFLVIKFEVSDLP